MGRNLAWLGVILFAVSWFVPVVKGQDAADAFRELGASASGERGSHAGPPGWQAFRFAWDLLTEGSEKGQDSWKARVCGATCLTNVAMVLALFGLLSLRSRAALLGMLLLGCAALNLSWIYLSEGEFREMLAVGYYLWTGSFVLVGLGLLAPRD